MMGHAPAVTLELSDIQGDILRAYGNAYDCTAYEFVHIDGTAEVARGWLRGLIGDVTTAAPWTRGKPTTTLNVAVTAAGLVALGVPQRVIDTFSPEFADGMAARSALLGDVGLSDPARWDEELAGGDPHVLVTVNAQTPEQLTPALDALRSGLERAGARIVFEQHAQLLAGAREHFGYADGFAQPAIAGSSDEKAAGGGVPEADGRWRTLAPGEFILGYPDEDTLVDSSARCRPRPPTRSGATGPTWSGASSTRTSRAGGGSCARRRRATTTATR